MTITRPRALRALRILRDLSDDVAKAGEPGWSPGGDSFNETECIAESRLAGYVEGLAALLTTMDEARTNAERTQEVMDALGTLASAAERDS